MASGDSEGPVRVGVDVGGTFTDLVALDEASGAVVYHKSPSTPADPSQAIATGIGELLSLAAVDPRRVSYFGHGTTVATNMVIEHRGASTALITTRGLRDVLEIGRQTRPNLYSYRETKPPPLARRRHRFEVTERLDASGDILTPLAESELPDIATALRDARIEAVAIALLHAYRNPVHEQAIEAFLKAELPGLFICRSSDVLPEFREFERTSTTTLNAFVGPRVSRYMDALRDRGAEVGLTVSPHTIQSNGGLMSVPAVKTYPVRTCLSGPAAGVVGAAVIGANAGHPDLVTFDVGGTSTDVSLILGGEPAVTPERLVAGHPVRSPMIDVHVIGAGGGSIAGIDDAGALKVGPRSAGASPGPVAYGRGGREATLTDANLVLGRLNPGGLLQGRMAVDAKAALAAVREQIAKPLGLSEEAAADGIVTVAVANIARAIRSVSTERGHDPAQLTLFAYGGAGPLHAVEVAREVECRQVLIPLEPGTLCARGILLSDLRTDPVRSLVRRLDESCWEAVQQTYAALLGEAHAWARNEKLRSDQLRLQPIVEARYEGQSFEIPVPVEALSSTTLAGFEERFHAAHEQTYGYGIPGRAIVIVNCRLQVTGEVTKAPLQHTNRTQEPDGVARPDQHRPVYLGSARGFVSIPVVDRQRLSSGQTLQGPAIIEEMSSTTYLGPTDQLVVDVLGNLIITVGPEADA